MSDRNVARIRTALPQAWGALAVWLLERYGIRPNDSTTDVAVFFLIPAAGAVLYDVGRTLEAHGYQKLGRLLLGSARQPVYTPAPDTYV